MLGVVGTRTLPRQAIARVSVSALVASLPLLYVSLLRPPPAALAGDTAFWFLMSNCVIAAIVATADDAGALFFGSSSNDDDDRPCNNDDAVVVPLTVDDPAAVVTMEGGAVQEEVVASTVAGSIDKDNTAVMMVVGGQGEGHGETASPTPASDRALAEPSEAETAEPEPWAVPKLVTSKSLPDHQEVQEDDEAADEEWPVPLYSRPPDVLAHGNGGRLRRSATGGSKSSVAEESEYWQLSDEELNRRVEDFIARFNRQMRLQIEQEAGV